MAKGRPKGQRNKPGHTAGRPKLGVIDVTLTLPPALVAWLDSLGPNRSATVTKLLQQVAESQTNL